MPNVLDLRKRQSGEAHEAVEPLLAATPVPEERAETDTSAESELPDETEDTVVPESGLLDVSTLAQQMLGEAPQMSASWTAHGLLRGEAKRRHFMLSVGLVVAGAVIAYTQSSIIPFFVLLMGAVALELREHLGKPVSVDISERGVMIDGQWHDHASFASFHIHRMPDETLELSLKTRKRYLPDLRLPLGEQDPEELHAVLTNYIPEEEHRIPLLEYLLRKPKR